MANDKRKKGCPNEQCEMHVKKVKQKASINFCPICGTKLIYVCAKCFTEIEDVDDKHRVCKLCEAEAVEKRKKRVDGAKKVAGKAGKGVVGAVVPVAAGIVHAVVKNGQKDAVKKGVKVVEDVANAALKK